MKNPKSIADFEIEGVKELVQRLRKLPDKLQKRLERRVIRQAMEIIEDGVIAAVPVGDTGELAESIKLRTRTKRGKLSARVDVKAPHAHLVEFGHKKYDFRGRRVIGERVPAYPFYRPVLDEKADDVVRKAAKGIEAELKKLEVKSD